MQFGKWTLHHTDDPKVYYVSSEGVSGGREVKETDIEKLLDEKYGKKDP